MTAKQLDLVRELRLYHSPSLFMEAAAEIERQAETISILQATANRLLAESIKREQRLLDEEADHRLTKEYAR